MFHVAFPLRLSSGLLRRQNETETFLALLQIMARTPEGSWPGCPKFGLRGYLEQAGRRPSLLKVAADSANSALEELGITGYHIESIEAAPSTGEGSVFDVFVDRHGSNQKYSLERIWNQ